MLDPFIFDFINNLVDQDLEKRWEKLHEFSAQMATQVALCANAKKHLTSIILLSHELLLTPIYLSQQLNPSLTHRPSIGIYLQHGFPSLSVLKLFPFTEDLLISMLSSDVISFQRTGSCSGFLKILKKNLGINHSINKGVFSLRFHGRLVIIRTAGLGTNLNIMGMSKNEKYDNENFNKKLENYIENNENKLMILFEGV